MGFSARDGGGGARDARDGNGGARDSRDARDGNGGVDALLLTTFANGRGGTRLPGWAPRGLRGVPRCVPKEIDN